MAGRLLSLWNKIIGRKSPSNYNQEMRDKLSNLMHFLDSKNDIETIVKLGNNIGEIYEK